MDGWGFWAVAFCLSVAVAAVLIGALRRARDESTASSGAAEADLAVYKHQMLEIDRDLGRGTIGIEEAGRLRAEIGKRVLEADRARTAGQSERASGRTGIIAALIVALTLPGGLFAYWGLGAPGYPDMALAPRLAELDAGIAGRPAQEAELVRLGKPRDAGLDSTLSIELAAIGDAAALRDRFRRHFEAGEFQAAVRTQERLIAAFAAEADANDHANLALALVVEAGGYVSPEAEAQLRESLQRDMGNELSRYLVGEMFLQGGRFDKTFQFWRPIAEGGNPAAPWVVSIRERIETVAGLAGVRYALPEAAERGPSAADVAAAGDLSPEDRQAMIDGMVAGFADRLASEGGPVEDWNRLIRSLAELGRVDEAQTIYDEAKLKFAGRAAELSFLRLAAVETGLLP
jgi:cytochrome c-type biogenesis protein CcmH